MSRRRAVAASSTGSAHATERLGRSLPEVASSQAMLEVLRREGGSQAMLGNFIPSLTAEARDPEDRVVDPGDANAKREKMLDKTIADSFPASDPPSTLPDPREDSFWRG